MTGKSQKNDLNAAGEDSWQSAVSLTRDHVSHNWHNLDNRLSLIAEAAYFKAEKRGFAAGHEEADWLEAEQELAEIMGLAVTG